MKSQRSSRRDYDSAAKASFEKRAGATARFDPIECAHCKPRALHFNGFLIFLSFSLTLSQVARETRISNFSSLAISSVLSGRTRFGRGVCFIYIYTYTIYVKTFFMHTDFYGEHRKSLYLQLDFFFKRTLTDISLPLHLSN